MGSKGLWCQSCAVHIDRPEIANGKLCCSFCGRVVSEDNWSEEVTFAKDAGGQERQQKRAAEARRNSTPPQTAAEATRQMLSKKRLDSKINYAVPDKLFEESNPKKSRADNVLHNNKTKLELEDRNEDSKLGLEDEYEDVAAGDFAGGYAGDIYYGNLEEGYDCNDMIMDLKSID